MPAQKKKKCCSCCGGVPCACCAIRLETADITFSDAEFPIDSSSSVFYDGEFTNGIVNLPWLPSGCTATSLQGAGAPYPNLVDACCAYRTIRSVGYGIQATNLSGGSPTGTCSTEISLYVLVMQDGPYAGSGYIKIETGLNGLLFFATFDAFDGSPLTIANQVADLGSNANGHNIIGSGGTVTISCSNDTSPFIPGPTRIENCGEPSIGSFIGSSSDSSGSSSSGPCFDVYRQTAYQPCDGSVPGMFVTDQYKVESSSTDHETVWTAIGPGLWTREVSVPCGDPAPAIDTTGLWYDCSTGSHSEPSSIGSLSSGGTSGSTGSGGGGGDSSGSLPSGSDGSLPVSSGGSAGGSGGSSATRGNSYKLRRCDNHNTLPGDGVRFLDDSGLSTGIAGKTILIDSVCAEVTRIETTGGVFWDGDTYETCTQCEAENTWIQVSMCTATGSTLLDLWMLLADWLASPINGTKVFKLGGSTCYIINAGNPRTKTMPSNVVTSAMVSDVYDDCVACTGCCGPESTTATADGTASDPQMIADLPAGDYRICYKEGAMIGNPDDTPGPWFVNNSFGSFGIWVSDGTSDLFRAPGDTGLYETAADAEAASAGASATFAWGGGSLYLHMVDSDYSDNSGSVSWCISPA